MWSPSPNRNKNSPQPGIFRRSFKSSFTSSSSSRSAASEYSSSDVEAPLAVLKVQVVGCTNLPAADSNGSSDPWVFIVPSATVNRLTLVAQCRYVVLTFGGQRVKTPVIKKTLSPRYLAKDATFELPVYNSAIETRGAFLDFVVWDKDLVGKGDIYEAHA